MAISKKVMNFCYGMGASVVIIGALFKITHMEFGPFNGNNMLTAGLLVEAFIFAISAFEPVDEELDWAKVYPELKDGKAREVKVAKQAVVEPQDTEGMLSKKLDQMLKDAKIDGELMNSLGNSIRNFEAASREMGPSVNSVASTQKYAQEMTLAAQQLESLNKAYKVQLESATANAEINKAVAENNAQLKEQMQALTNNLASLNNVYGGMLSAMGGGRNAN
ncbi:MULTISPECIES: gliding motility protein GldL [Myroides]|uniref:Gliding motility protein GldL n=3 Tax=Myroides odoratimimus TaxID=76832 RepID=A0A0S7EDH6_9FLAO|nr:MULTISPECIES: gliding motility protein GldL [Myroides]AJA67939.1 gliding motility-associated protein GldL [Myroides sp. A21]ALU25216.1 gliding motility protein GldL [Myroides odoratimimus]APA91262.1 gliding motility protein GldL [Myroides sp. ZB35]EHO04856.1 gliding motility-associated protein GldL [Myroides odoratimimus CIP 101113]EHO05343.1 gliding motility-associated protein GldL [Myroides odoratimimus CCUG 12901]